MHPKQRELVFFSIHLPNYLLNFTDRTLAPDLFLNLLLAFNFLPIFLKNQAIKNLIFLNQVKINYNTNY
jgi:hypothetical protein